ncbi:MAG: MBL fold metallo-hydrolase [Phycisphaerales bacterium]|nr:MBL fold metallo-hydrolase [Phycisphaerales bacterium]
MAWSHTLLRNGTFWLDAGCMFGLTPRVVWTRWLEPDGKNRTELQQNALLLEGEGKLVVVECGIGDKTGEKERKIYTQQERAIHDSLREVNCDPKDIDAVIVTHLHFDHAGGLTRKGPDDKPVLTFPNAEIIVQRQEWDDAIANRSTMNKTYLREHLTPEVAERVRLIEGEAAVFEDHPDLRVFPTPGHTWGQQSVRFEDAKRRVRCFVADVMPTHYHCKATTNLAYDVEPYTSMLERTKLLDRAAAEGWAILPNHEPNENPWYGVVSYEDKGSRAWALEPA